MVCWTGPASPGGAGGSWLDHPPDLERRLVPRPKGELERVVAAIEAAKVELDEREVRAATRTRAVPMEIMTIERPDGTEVGLTEAPSDATVPYIGAVLPPAPSTELHETPLSTLVGFVQKVVSAEAPVHRDEVVTRVRSAWGLCN